MMQEEGDPAEIAKAMQDDVQGKMKALYQDALKQSVSLAEQMVKQQLDSFRSEFKPESAMDKLNSRIRSEIPKAATEENKVVLGAILPVLMKQTNNDPDKAFKLLTTFFRKTNKSILGNNEQRGRFGVKETDTTSSGELTLESLGGFLG